MYKVQHLQLCLTKFRNLSLPAITVSCRHYRYRRDVYGFKSTANDIRPDRSDLKDFGEVRGEIKPLIDAYRVHGHKIAGIYPLNNVPKEDVPELDQSFHGLSHADVINSEGETTGNLLSKLVQTFCGSISLESSYIEDRLEREWLYEKFGSTQEKDLPNNVKINICEKLLKSEVVDNFLAVKFPTLKRYGCEGAESMLAFVHYLMRSLSEFGTEQLIAGMNHRGRNNLLLGELGFPPQVMFRKIKGQSEFPPEALTIATGDVLSHLNASTDISFDGSKLHVNLLSNPSHLEAVNPVVMGKCRARQQSLKEGDYSLEGDETSRIGDKVASLCIHGDAAFTGQGVIMECFNMSQIPHFNVGGTIHLIVNNLLGFTTPWHHGRSTRYASDIGKLIGCPVLHVNADSPEDVVKASQLAAEYRHTFRKDIIVDLLCYRRWGHNEMDDQSFTQPLTEKSILDRQSLPEKYVEKLKEENLVSDVTVEAWRSEENKRLSDCLKQCENEQPAPSYLHKDSSWGGMTIPRVDQITEWDTGCHGDILRYVGAKSVEVPEWFSLNEHLQKVHVTSRLTKLQSGVNIDWSLAEAMAIGSLLHQNYDVRLCGQDVGRGTFSHRHCFLVDQENGTVHVPLNHMHNQQTAHIEVVNSLLSEEAVLGFEYGVSIESPKRLAIWESQFGDFFNGAQIMIDTFVSSGEVKWMYQSGLVILLPHGYDGAGPEHSSCRVERFLQMTNSSEVAVDGDGVNMSVAHPTTPAQYFHLLRRQMVRNFRKPLIMVAPKVLLRHQSAVSSMSEFEPGTSFQPVIGDKLQSAKAVVFCSGKHYYALEREREAKKKADVAIVRLEELCPFPAGAIQRELAKHKNASSFTWSQEEPRNMGAWNFVAPRFENLLGVKLRYAGRPALSAPAVGIGEIHNQQSKDLLNETFS